MTTVHTLYSVIISDLKGDKRRQAKVKKELASKEGRVTEFKRILVETFVEPCTSALYTLKYHLLDQLVEYKRRLGLIPVQHSSPHEHFNVHINQVFKRTLQRSRIQMMETVN